MEFYQFHPTALSLPGAPRFLLSEALRGEGAYLRNDHGERFMERYHPLLELAPRDVVARAIAREGIGEARQLPAPSISTCATCATSTSTSVSPASAPSSRPTVSISPATSSPSVPPPTISWAASAPTSPDAPAVGGLYAAGEAACTGVHGANRLASNSLLEGLVFGARAAQSMLADGLPLEPVDADLTPTPEPLSASRRRRKSNLSSPNCKPICGPTPAFSAKSPHCARDSPRKPHCDAALAEIAKQGKTSRRLAEAQALSRVAHAILHSALARTESRGAHFRNDFPNRDDQNFQRHSVLTRDARVLFEEW